jgi:hypothetical protein
MSGSNNPNYGKTTSEETREKIGAAKQGENNPMFGTVAPNAVGVSVYTLDGKLVQSFSSQTAAAKFLGVGQSCISQAIRRGHIVNSLYRVASTS